jgi:NAD-dependent histone deacetylase SIR2
LKPFEREVHRTARSAKLVVSVVTVPLSSNLQVISAEERVARSARPLKVGTLRPSIVLYDEPHPLGDDIGTIQTVDLAKKPDMLIIMGTSLKVHGLRKLVKEFARVVHDQKSGSGKVIFVNKTAPASEWDGIIDYHVAGETDSWTVKVVEDWKKSRPQDWEVQKTLLSETLADQGFKIAKQGTVGKVKKSSLFRKLFGAVD